MANNVLTLQLDTADASGSIRAVTGQLGGLDKVLTSLGRRLGTILAGAKLVDFLSDAAQATGRLDNEFLVLRLALGKLRMEIGRAVEPIAQVVLPALNQAVFAAIRAVKYVGKIIRALLGMTDRTYDTADAQKELAASVTATGKAVTKSLAAFDRLERLNAGGTGSTGGGTVSTGSLSQSRPFNYELDLGQYMIVKFIKEMLEPLQAIDLTPLKTSLEGLGQAMLPLTVELFSGLNWAWTNIFAPMAQWTAEKLLPAFVDTLAAAVQALGDTLNACKPALNWLWDNFLLPVAQWTGQAILDGLSWLREKLEGISDWMVTHQITVGQLITAVGLVAAAVTLLNGGLGSFLGIGGQATGAIGSLGGALTVLQSVIGLVIGLVAALSGGVILLIANWDQVAAAAGKAWQGIKNAWQGARGWFDTNVLGPIKNGFRETINGIIGFFNGLISGAVSGINALVKAVNKLKFDVPDWVPGIGGEKLGFNLKTVSAPKIPYLAQGAVLPANKPFLAVVGDQRHGTNVEAPLATIQEAVRQVTTDQTDAILAGFSASLGVQKQILEAVLGIRIGDEVIGAAMDRYRSKMAVIAGL